MRSGIYTRKCPICDKEFVTVHPLSTWVYQRGGKIFCSYHCMSKYLENKKYYRRKMYDKKIQEKTSND